MKSLLPLAIAIASAWSAELVLPPSPLERAAPVPVFVGGVEFIASPPGRWAASRAAAFEVF